MPQQDFTGNAQKTALLGALLASAGVGSVFTVATGGGTGHPTGSLGLPWVECLDRGGSTEEKILCSSRTGDSFTIAQRGYDGTAVVDHPNGAVVEHTIDATLLKNISAHIYDTTRDDHHQYVLADGSRPVSGPMTFESSIGVDTTVTAEVGTATQTTIGTIGSAGGGMQVGGGTPVNYVAVIAANTWGIFTNTAQQVKVDDGGGAAGSSALSIRENSMVQRVLVGPAGTGPGGAGKVLYLA